MEIVVSGEEHDVLPPERGQRAFCVHDVGRGCAGSNANSVLFQFLLLSALKI